jgi:hypothetical protein
MEVVAAAVGVFVVLLTVDVFVVACVKVSSCVARGGEESVAVSCIDMSFVDGFAGDEASNDTSVE